MLISTTHERFRNGRAPNGSKWKRGLKGTGQTLVLSRLLRNSITKRFSYEGVEVGTNVNMPGYTRKAVLSGLKS